MEINDFFWHDAIIKSISIDRYLPGKKDEISFYIVWLGQKRKIKIYF